MTSSTPDIAELRAFAETLADAARAAILPHFREAPDVHDKGPGKADGRFDPVTAADRDAEGAMRALIEARFPDHGIEGEEFGVKPAQCEFSWILDPIDGTRAFIAGLPLWGVLIGLYRNNRPYIGIMDQPYLDERFFGWPGGAELIARGARRPLKARHCATLADAIVSSTDVHLFAGAESHAFARVRTAAKLTRYGYDCYAYCMVALGGLDIVIESGLKAYDIAALIPILEGAGGGVCSWSGADASQGGQVLAWGDARARDAALTLLKDAAIS